MFEMELSDTHVDDNVLVKPILDLTLASNIVNDAPLYRKSLEAVCDELSFETDPSDCIEYEKIAVPT